MKKTPASMNQFFTRAFEGALGDWSDELIDELMKDSKISIWTDHLAFSVDGEFHDRKRLKISAAVTAFIESINSDDDKAELCVSLAKTLDRQSARLKRAANRPSAPDSSKTSRAQGH